MEKVKIFSEYTSDDASSAAEELTKRINNWMDTKKEKISVEDIVVHTQACATNTFPHFFLTVMVKYIEEL